MARRRARTRIPFSLLILLLSACVLAGCAIPANGPDGWGDAALPRGPQVPPAPPAAAPSGGNLTVVFINVGQGDSTLLVGGNASVLVDAGKASAAREAVLLEISARNMSVLAAAVATHADADHIGGFPAVFSRINASSVWDSGLGKGTGAYSDYSLAAARLGVRYPKRGLSESFGDGFSLEVLNPTDPHQFPADDYNNNGIVLLARKGAYSFLLTADCEAECEDSLVQAGLGQNSTVLKVGHHGSKYSTGASFLAWVRPEYGVISVGQNSYNHPAPEALGRLSAAGVEVLRTDERGTIYATTDGKNGISWSSSR